VFELLTEPGRRVLAFALGEARSLNHVSVGTEHLVLGLFRQRDGDPGQELLDRARTEAAFDGAFDGKAGSRASPAKIPQSWPESIAAQALRVVSASVDDVRAQILQIRPSDAGAIPGPYGLAERAKTALMQSRVEAVQLGHVAIGPERILLGILREEEGVGVDLLVRLGADPNELRARVLQLMQQRGTARVDPPA